MHTDGREAIVFERDERRCSRATSSEHGDRPTAIDVGGRCRQELAKATNIRVVTDEFSGLDPERVHCTDARRERRHARAPHGYSFLVRNRDVAPDVLANERVERGIELAGRDVHRFVANGQSRAPQRSVLKRGRERMSNRVAEENEATREARHDVPGACSAAIRSNTRLISCSSSSYVAR